jgi:hypothetical protein
MGRCPRFANLPRLAVGGVPGPRKIGDPDFLYAALDAAAYAAFFEESRMKSPGATRLHRKSGKSLNNRCYPLTPERPSI